MFVLLQKMFLNPLLTDNPFLSYPTILAIIKYANRMVARILNFQLKNRFSLKTTSPEVLVLFLQRRIQELQN